MKKAFKRILSVAIGLCIALMGVFVMPTITASAASVQYEETSFGVGTFLITTIFNGKTYYLPATTTSSSPKAVAFTDKDDISDEHLWTVTASGSNYYIKNSKGNYLYTTNSNSGVRVGGTNNAWTYNSSNKSLKDTKTNRFLGIYNAQDWRCYTTVNQNNYQESSTSFIFYKVKEVDNTTAAAQEAVNGVQSYMRLAYNYKVNTEIVEESTTIDITDTLNRGLTGVTDTSYTSWSGKTSESTAVYAGQSAGGNDSIQLRSNNSNSGIITTASGGNLKKITVTWNSGTESGRTLDVYGKNTAYSSPTELYSSSTQGTKIGSIVCGTSTELVVERDYTYIGLRSNSGAMYLTEIKLTWETENPNSGTKEETTLTNSNFMIQCGVDASLLSIANADEAGICVTAGGKTRYYHEGDSNSWKVDGDKVYVVINLGDIGANNERLTTEFTVAAYVKVGENTCVAEDKAKKHSVASMVKEYYEDAEITEVEHLYNYLISKSLITEDN